MISKLGQSTLYEDLYNPNLLEFFPRKERRDYITAPLFGWDIWTCYELSFLLENGVPYFCPIRIVNPANSDNIFESKSLKLYLNSFNNTHFRSFEEARQKISNDLSVGVNATVMVSRMYGFTSTEFYSLFQSIDQNCNKIDQIEDYRYNPKLLRTEKCSKTKEVALFSTLLRSNCEITSQPDWAHVYVSFHPKGYTIDQVSLLKYIISYRKHQEFHEPTCERIFNDLYELLQPHELTVVCQYTRRGGIDINPIRSTRSDIPIYNLPKLLSQ